MSDELSQTLARASFEGVAFPVVHAPVDSEHDHVLHKVYLRPGADIEACGLGPKTGELRIPCLTSLGGYGTLYPDVFQQLVALFEGTPIGRLTHPAYGTFPALMKHWRVDLAADVRNGVWLTVQWVENSAESILALSAPQTSPRDATAATAGQAATADGALSAAGSAYQTAPTITATLVTLQASTALSYLATRAAINTMLASVNTALALPVLATWTAAHALDVHAAVVALEILRVYVYQLQAQYLPGLARIRVYLTPYAMSPAEVAVVMYADLDQASAVRAANGLVDAEIPAGTTLTILPLD